LRATLRLLDASLEQSKAVVPAQPAQSVAKPAPGFSPTHWNIDVAIGELGVHIINSSSGTSFPELRFILCPTKLHADGLVMHLHAELKSALVADFYNVEVLKWEPILERTSISVAVEVNHPSTVVNCSVPECIQLCVSARFLLSLLSLLESLTQGSKASSGLGLNQRTQHYLGVRVVNHLLVPLTLYEDRDKAVCDAEDKVPLAELFGEQSSMRLTVAPIITNDQSSDSVVSFVELCIDGKQPLRRLSPLNPGSYACTLYPAIEASDEPDAGAQIERRTSAVNMKATVTERVFEYQRYDLIKVRQTNAISPALPSPQQ
jgi:hypothetical protein